MLVEMTEKEMSFLEFGLRKSEENYRHYLDLDLDKEDLEFFKHVTEESHKKARKLQEDESQDFNAFLKNFLDSYQ